MRHPIGLSKSFRVGIVLVAGSFLAAMTSLVDSRSPTAIANDWAVRGALLGTLPHTLDEYAALPTEHRRAAYRAMSPAAKSHLWKEHLARFASDARLSGEQVDFIKKLGSLATPQLYDRSAERSVSERAALKELCQQGQSILSSELRGALSHVGPRPVPVPAGRFRTLLRSLSAFAHLVVSADEALDCTCTTESWCEGCDEGAGQGCKNGDCTRIYDECGCLGTVDCTGRCQLLAN